MTNRFTRSLILIAAALALPVSVARAQDTVRSAPRQLPDSTEAAMDAMMPMMGRMMTAMMRGTLTFLAEPETAQQMATFTRNYFDALVAKGFTREESLRIVMAVGIPMGPGQR